MPYNQFARLVEQQGLARTWNNRGEWKHGIHYKCRTNWHGQGAIHLTEKSAWMPLWPVARVGFSAVKVRQITECSPPRRHRNPTRPQLTTKQQAQQNNPESFDNKPGCTAPSWDWLSSHNREDWRAYRFHDVRAAMRFLSDGTLKPTFMATGLSRYKFW